MYQRILKPSLIILIVLLLSVQLIAETGRIPTRRHNGMVVSSHALASEVGKQVLEEGGNAIDAAIATAFALSVTLPSAGNIGGGGFLVYHSADGAVTAFNFREKSPLKATQRMYLNSEGEIQGNSNHRGILSVGVPGTVAGLYLAHQRLGSKPWNLLVEPAVRLASDGFSITWALADDMESYARIFKEYPTTARKFYKDGKTAYQPGEIWRQPDLAATLQRIAEQGKDGFYRGTTARLIEDYMEKHGGIITRKDLAKYTAREQQPVHGTYRGYDVYAMSPPSSGGVALVEMLNILEGYNLRKIGHNSGLYLHLLTESMRRAYADRARFLGDPEFNPDMPVDSLTSKAYAENLRSTIDFYSASKSDPEQFNVVYEGDHTTHFSVVDKERNMVSLTYTLEQSYGSKMTVEGGGFLLNNEMGDFNPVPGRTDSTGLIGTPPNLIAPEKRMLSSMTPTIIAKDGKPLMAIGSPGGRTIINTVLQVTLNVIDHEMNIARAIDAGRIHHQWLPDFTSFERWMISPDTRQMYENFGHRVRTRNSQGRAMGIYIDWESGILYGAADSRSPDGRASGY